MRTGTIRSFLRRAALLTAAILILAGFAYADKTVLKVTWVPKRPAVGPWERARVEGFEEFLRRNPDIELVAAQGVRPPVDLQWSGQFLALAGGAAPDVPIGEVTQPGLRSQQG